MRTVRKLVAALACTALLSVVGAAAAGAEGSGRCNRLASITARVAAKTARRAAKPAAANAGQRHQARLEAKDAKFQQKLAELQARCSG